MHGPQIVHTGVAAPLQERLWDAEEQLRSIAAQKAALQGLSSSATATRPNGAQQEQQQPNSGAASPGRLKNSSRGSRLALLAAEEAGPDAHGGADSGTAGSSSRDSSSRGMAVQHGGAAANGGRHGVQRGAPDAGGGVGAGEDEMDEMLRSMSLHHSASVPLALLRRQSSAGQPAWAAAMLCMLLS